jgi:endonuclease III
MNVAFGEATIAVDTHIFRVGNRTGLAPGKNPLEVELRLLKRVPEEYRLHAHHWLILHGRYTCKAVSRIARAVWSTTSVPSRPRRRSNDRSYRRGMLMLIEGGPGGP